MIAPETLRRYPLFARQSFYMLNEIAMLSDEVRLKRGEWLFNEAEEATRLYLILEGAITLSVYLYLNGTGQYIETMSPLGPGEVVGWSALVKPHIYNLGAMAEQDSRLAAIDALLLRQLLDDNPQYGFHLMKRLSEVIGERLTHKCIQLLSIVLDAKGEPISPTA